MKKLPLFRCSLLLAVIVVFAYCKKGDTGPQGPPGTANVIYSNWLDVTFSPQVAAPGDTSWSATINAPKLTDTILNRGEVKVYVNFNTPASPLVFALPITSDLRFVIIPYYEVGKINLVSDLDAGTEVSAGQKYFQYRYVLIPGGVTARMATIDWNNYGEVKKYLGLKD